jgi:membrane protein
VYILNLILTFLITSFIFAIIFEVLPDAKVEWKHVRVGAFTTAFFFMAGKFLISYYLGHSTMTTTYGAAGSIIIVLLWVYYSSMILYFGAAFTREYAIEMGSRIYPNKYAVWVEQVEIVSQKPLSLTPDAQKAAEEIKLEDSKT